MVQNDVQLLNRGDRLLHVLDAHINNPGNFAPGLLDIFNLVNIQQARIRPELLPDLVIDRHIQRGEQIPDRVPEHIEVAGRGAVNEPGNPLETNSRVDNFNRELLVLPVGEVLELHEHHVAELQPVDEVLHAGAEVASSGPHVLDVGDLVGVDAQLLGQPAVVELDALLLEELVLVGVVEDLDAQHHEAFG